jgi:hypothetical protein
MPKRSRKPRLPDPSELAFAIVQLLDPPPAPAPADDGKDPAAVTLGRKGGVKGGKARAKALTKKSGQIAREKLQKHGGRALNANPYLDKKSGKFARMGKNFNVRLSSIQVQSDPPDERGRTAFDSRL